MTCFIFAGEVSGDMHGASLVAALKQELPFLSFSGVPGPEMRKEGVKPILTMEQFSVMGFSDVLKSFLRLFKQFNLLKKSILKEKPDMVIFIDSPSLSLKLGEKLKEAGYKGKIVQYISPTVWAWGEKRIKTLESFFDLLLTIYPFEKKCFSHSSLNVQYIGNPVKERIDLYSYQEKWKEDLKIPSANSLVALFPGSRKGEIQRNLPKILKSCHLLRKKYPEILFGVSVTDENNKKIIQSILNEYDLKGLFFIPKKYTYELMKEARGSIAKSGTVTLELALHQCPTVVVYELTFLNRFIATYFIKPKVSNFCIVNILGEKVIFPELIKKGFSSENLYHQFLPLLEEGSFRDACLQSCQNIIQLFPEKNVSLKAAIEIKKLLHKQ